MSVNEISLFTPVLAIVFGLLSFASPCCLPLLPSGDAGRGRPLGNGLGFVAGLGLSLVFALLGTTASALGSLLLQGRPLLMQVLLDEHGDLASSYGVRALPARFGIDPTGRLRQQRLGALVSGEVDTPWSRAWLAKQVQALLASTPQARSDRGNSTEYM